jgi:hypothetical protein
MLNSILGKAADLVGKRFLLALLLPCLVCAAAIGSLIITAHGWTAATTSWRGFPTIDRWLILGGTTVAVFFLAVTIGAQINSFIACWEGYWFRKLRIPGIWLQKRRYKRLSGSDSDWATTRRLREYPNDPADFLPTRLGNTLLAAENYSRARYGLDSVLFWPRQYLLMPDSVRQLVDDARMPVDQNVVLATLSLLTSVVAVVMGVAGYLTWVVWVPAAGATILLCAVTYRSAVQAASMFGDVIRSVCDLYRGDLLNKLGFTTPASRDEEQQLWAAIGKILYRGDPDTDQEDILRRYAANSSPQPARSPQRLALRSASLPAVKPWRAAALVSRRSDRRS